MVGLGTTCVRFFEKIFLSKKKTKADVKREEFEIDPVLVDIWNLFEEQEVMEASFYHHQIWTRMTEDIEWRSKLLEFGFGSFEGYLREKEEDRKRKLAKKAFDRVLVELEWQSVEMRYFSFDVDPEAGTLRGFLKGLGAIIFDMIGKAPKKPPTVEPGFLFNERMDPRDLAFYDAMYTKTLERRGRRVIVELKNWWIKERQRLVLERQKAAFDLKFQPVLEEMTRYFSKDYSDLFSKVLLELESKTNQPRFNLKFQPILQELFHYFRKEYAELFDKVIIEFEWRLLEWDLSELCEQLHQEEEVLRQEAEELQRNVWRLMLDLELYFVNRRCKIVAKWMSEEKLFQIDTLGGILAFLPLLLTFITCCSWVKALVDSFMGSTIGIWRMEQVKILFFLDEAIRVEIEKERELSNQLFYDARDLDGESQLEVERDKEVQMVISVVVESVGKRLSKSEEDEIIKVASETPQTIEKATAIEEHTAVAPSEKIDRELKAFLDAHSQSKKYQGWKWKHQWWKKKQQKSSEAKKSAKEKKEERKRLKKENKLKKNKQVCPVQQKPKPTVSKHDHHKPAASIKQPKHR